MPASVSPRCPDCTSLRSSTRLGRTPRRCGSIRSSGGDIRRTWLRLLVTNRGFSFWRTKNHAQDTGLAFHSKTEIHKIRDPAGCYLAAWPLLPYIGEMRAANELLRLTPTFNVLFLRHSMYFSSHACTFNRLKHRCESNTPMFAPSTAYAKPATRLNPNRQHQ